MLGLTFPVGGNRLSGSPEQMQEQDSLSRVGEAPPGCVALQSICYAMSFSCLALFSIDQDGNVCPCHLAEKAGEWIQSPVVCAC